MKSAATNVNDYIAEAPEQRRAALTTLRKLILRIAPDASEEMGYGMATYKRGDTLLAAFASQKNNMALYACNKTTMEKFSARLKKLKLDCGKSCLRFKQLTPEMEALFAEILVDVIPK